MNLDDKAPLVERLLGYAFLFLSGFVAVLILDWVMR
jgi:hypothetical protein